MFLYNPIGKTLAEVHKDCGGNIDGYSVFVLQDKYDTIGKPLDEDFSIGLILKKHPQYANCKVKYENDFYGTTVLRVEKGGEEACNIETDMNLSNVKSVNILCFRICTANIQRITKALFPPMIVAEKEN